MQKPKAQSRYRIVKGSLEYPLPEYSVLTGIGHTVRSEDEERAFTHGSIEIADGMIEAATRELEISIFADDMSGYDRQMDELLQNIYQEDYKLYLPNGRYLNIKKVEDIDHEFYEGYAHIKAEITVTLKCTDPFQYEQNPSIEVRTLTESPQEIAITRTGGIDIYPVITIEATQNCPNIAVINTSDKNRTFQYNDVNFLAGKRLIIDSVNGTLYRVQEEASENTLRSMTGSFPRLVRGVNVFRYTGNDCVITFEYTRRWL